jgi:hypothetical protein
MMPAPDDSAAVRPAAPGTPAPSPSPRTGTLAPSPGDGPGLGLGPGSGGGSAAPRFDPAAPHPARVYAYWLGGKDHFPADRKLAEQVLAHRPQVVTGARANRDFLVRAVEHLAAGAGVRQFLDIGAGLPAPGCTHLVAQAIAPDSRIVYVDHDPLVLAHARALLTGGTREGAVACVDADVRDPAAVLAGAARTLDLSRPVAVLLLAVLHSVSDAGDPAGIVAGLARGLPPGSYLAISHLTADFAPRQVGAAVDAWNAVMPTPLTARTHRQVSGLFGGLPLVAPGVVPVSGWRPRPLAVLPVPADLYAGLARITRPALAAGTGRPGAASRPPAWAGTRQAGTWAAAWPAAGAAAWPAAGAAAWPAAGARG